MEDDFLTVGDGKIFELNRFGGYSFWWIFVFVSFLHCLYPHMTTMARLVQAEIKMHIHILAFITVQRHNI